MIPKNALTRLLLVAPIALAGSLLHQVAGAADYLAAEPMGDTKVRIDGMLREWPGGFAKMTGSSGAASKNSALIGYDDEYIYLAGKLTDSNLVRTKAAGKGEDRLVLEIHFPSASGGAGTTHRVDVYPGLPGKLGAVVKVDGKEISSATAIEAPTDTGLTLEARIPWKELTAARALRVGMRGKISYEDASAVGRIQSVTATSSGSGRNMQPLTIGPETGLAETLLGPKDLGFRPAREVYGDVTGKGKVSKIALYGHFLSIVGPDYKGGKQFYFNELDVERADQVTRLEVLDFNGDNKSEIILQKKLGKNEKYREVIQVLQIGNDGAPVQVFMHEVAIVTPDGKVENKVKISGSGKNARITVEQGSSKGFEPGTFQEPTIGKDIPSALLPWQSVKSRTFGWKGAGLALIDEETWEPKMKSSSGAASRAAQKGAPQKDAPPPPRPPSADEMLDRVYGLYKQDRGVSRGKKPSFDFVTDVVEDEQMERVLVHERDLVVFGKGFKKGLSYTFLTIGVKEPEHILSVTSRDLVGDGKAEIIVHAVLDAQASKSLGGDIVRRQALFVYKVIGENLTRVFAAETARSLKGNRIMSSLAFLPNGTGTDLELRPLRAVGWTEKTYPFPEDQHPAGGLEPLLLPWTQMGTRRYSFNGSEYVLK